MQTNRSLIAAAKTGKIINVKKGQFSPLGYVERYKKDRRLGNKNIL